MRLLPTTPQNGVAVVLGILAVAIAQGLPSEAGRVEGYCGPEPALIVTDSLPKYGDKAIAVYDCRSNAVYVLPAYSRSASILAHEYGHWLGFSHPPEDSLDWHFDVMGASIIPLTDHLHLIERSASWRALNS